MTTFLGFISMLILGCINIGIAIGVGSAYGAGIGFITLVVISGLHYVPYVKYAIAVPVSAMFALLPFASGGEMTAETFKNADTETNIMAVVIFFMTLAIYKAFFAWHERDDKVGKILNKEQAIVVETAKTD